MDYILITIAIILTIVTYFTCKWAFRVLVIIALIKLITQLKEKGLKAFTEKMAGGNENAEM